MDGRRDKHNYYLDIAETVLKRGTCLRRNYGGIIVKHDEIISTGYSGAPRKRKNCIDLGFCRREKMNIPRGERYELCRSVHSEMNCILSAPRNQMIGATMYLAGRDANSGELVGDLSCCALCKRLIINAGIERVIFRNSEDTYSVVYVDSWIENDESLTEEQGY